jgi:hypothetical protein
MTGHTHEKSDLNPKYILYFAAGLLLLGLVSTVVVWWMFHMFEEDQARRESQPVAVEVPSVVPEPRLQISPSGDLEELRRQEQEILSTYRWIDRDKGTARIPIDRAMELFIERQKR